MELNEAKLQSPLILIDPTFKDRNALAALSYKTFYNFRDYCLKFLKNPSAKFFEPLDRESLLRKKYSDVTEIKITTDRQSGDIAGTKLKKFSEFFLNETRRFFDVKESLFKYDDKSSGKIILILKEKKERIFTGPPISMEEPLRKFKLEHKKIVVKNGQAFAYGKSPSFEEFFKDFLNEKAKVIEPMSIVGIEIVR
jgi:tRNA nucleotidyltransferase (CCA-adding enzyme)